MRFLLVSYNFSPEKTGIGKYNGEWVQWLVKRGHQVDVITTNPYYPEWKVDEAYRGKWWSTERTSDLTVYRVPMYIPARVTGLSRMLSDFSFGMSSLTIWIKLLLKRKRYDVVIAICPSMLNGIVPAIYCRFSDSLMLYHIQDLQLDAATKLGFIKNPWLLTLLKKIEMFQLDSADIVSSISAGMKEKILAKGVEEGKYFMLENWVDIGFIKPIENGNEVPLKAELGFGVDDKVILYSGNLGEKQGIEVIIEAAELLKEERQWKFLICGEGVAKEALFSATKKKKLSQVRFAPLQAYERLPELLNMADIHLVPQKKAAADLVLPSKLTGILASGGVAIVASEAGASLYRLINENAIGYTVEPENATDLAAVIRKALAEDSALIKKRARNFAEKNMSREAILAYFEGFIEKKVLDTKTL